MTQPFRFIHSSDLHLDRAPRGLAEMPDAWRPMLIDAPYRAAERIFDAALKERVDFLVLAGDVVDPGLAGPRALVFLAEQFARLAQQGIRVYWSGGRADHFEHWADLWPLAENVVRFSRERVERIVHRKDGLPIAQILGTSSTQRKRIRLSEFQPDAGELFTVAVVHGAADAETLANQSVHYWALGGDHQRRAILTGPVVAHYSGSPQGRRPNETGPHGCTMVQVDDTGRVRTAFVPTDAVRYLDERIVVNEPTTQEQLHQVMVERVTEMASDPFGPDLLVRWTITGSRPLAAELRRGKLATELLSRLRSEFAGKRPSVWTVSVEPEQSAGVPAELYEEETLLGEFLRTVQHYVDEPEAPLNLEPYLAERHVAGSLTSAVSLEDPAVRQKVLAEVARLGAELLHPQETRR